MLHIRTCENGYVVIETDDYDGDRPLETCVIEEREELYCAGTEAQARADAGQRLLWTVMDKLNLVGSKHDSHRLHIEIEEREDG